MRLKLISLCPSITHTIFALGKGDELVGVTRFCVKPEDGVARIEKVGGTKNPKLERIVALKPDLVFLNREENRREDWQALGEKGIRCHVSFPDDIASSIAMLREFGELLHCGRQAELLVEAIEAVKRRIQERKHLVETRSWAYLIWRKPWMTVNRTTYIHGLIREVGGENVFGTRAPAYPEINADELAQASPELVLLSSEPFPFKPKHIEELSTATGLPESRFRLVDGERLSWHGALSAEGLAYAFEVFAGEALGAT